MAKTRHIEMRMNQRGITSEMLNLVKSFGEFDQGDHLILNKKGIRNALTEMRKMTQALQKMESKGGVVLVTDNGSDITAYDLGSYKH